MAAIFTIGHSTRDLHDFIAALRAHGVQRLVDIRSFPMSRRLPHFNRESLEHALPAAGIDYVWRKDLGGRRSKIREDDDSPNRGLRVPGFRNYADYMLTEGFQKAAADLVELAEEKSTAIMCAERLYFRCHRMLVSDYLVAHGHDVVHIEDADKPPRPHKLMAEARLEAPGRLIYPGLF